MSILSNRQIVERLGDSVVIDPFNPANVNTSSYDVTLGDWYFIEHKPSLWRRLLGNSIYNIWDAEHVKRVWGEPQQARSAMSQMSYNALCPWVWNGVHPTDQVILLPPKHTILAHTNEFIGGRDAVIRGPEGLRYNSGNPSTTMMKARSSFGRNFIEVCKCAGYGDVGYTNRWTMEITNNSRFYHIPLVVGRRIAQIVFMETGPLDGDSDYVKSGKYQETPNIEKLKAEWRPEMMLPRLDRDRDFKR